MEKTYLISMNAEELEALITRCVRNVLAEMKLDMLTEQKPTMGGIELAAHVTGLAKPTIYALASKRVIPHKKVGNRLYFVESELVDWINSHHRKTLMEIRQEADDYINSRPLTFRKTRR